MGRRRFYWFKMKEDFFKGNGIFWLEDQPGGGEAILFYLKLCCEALRLNGRLCQKVDGKLMNFDQKTIAKLTGVDIKIVKKSMILLQKVQLILADDDGIFYLPEMEFGSETEDAIIKRRYRSSLQNQGNKEAKETRQHTQGNMDKFRTNTPDYKGQNQDNVQDNVSIYRYRDRDREDIEKELEGEVDISNEHSPYEYTDKSKQDVFNFWDRNIQPLREYTKDELQELLKEYGASVVMLAMKRALDNNARSLSYVKAAAAGIASGEPKKKKGNVLTMECPWPEW